MVRHPFLAWRGADRGSVTADRPTRSFKWCRNAITTVACTRTQGVFSPCSPVSTEIAAASAPAEPAPTVTPAETPQPTLATAVPEPPPAAEAAPASAPPPKEKPATPAAPVAPPADSKAAVPPAAAGGKEATGTIAAKKRGNKADAKGNHHDPLSSLSQPRAPYLKLNEVHGIDEAFSGAHGQPTAMTANAHFIAVGTAAGHVVLFNTGELCA